MNNKRDALYPGYVVPVKESSTAGAAKGGITSEENSADDLTDEQIEDLAVVHGVESREFSSDLTIKFARAAIAAHLARQPKAEQPVIKTWQERVDTSGRRECESLAMECMMMEIADLRAALARQAQAEPVAEVISEVVSGTALAVRGIRFIGGWARPGDKLYLAPVAPASAQNAAQAEPVDIEAIRQIADELELEASSYEGDFADTVNGCADALRHLVDANQAIGTSIAQPDGWIAPAYVTGELTSVAFKDLETANATCAEGKPIAFFLSPQSAGAQNAEAIRNQWISVDERLPKEKARTLIAYESDADGEPCLDVGYGRLDNDGWKHAGTFYDNVGAARGRPFVIRETCNVKVTHWMPLPEAPSQSGTASTKTGEAE